MSARTPKRPIRLRLHRLLDQHNVQVAASHDLHAIVDLKWRRSQHGFPQERIVSEWLSVEQEDAP